MTVHGAPDKRTRSQISTSRRSWALMSVSHLTTPCPKLQDSIVSSIGKWEIVVFILTEIPNVARTGARTCGTAVQPELAASTRAHWRRHSVFECCNHGSDDCWGGLHALINAMHSSMHTLINARTHRGYEVSELIVMVMVVVSVDGESRSHGGGLYQTFDKNITRRSCGMPGAVRRSWIDVWTWYCDYIWGPSQNQKRLNVACEDGLMACDDGVMAVVVMFVCVGEKSQEECMWRDILLGCLLCFVVWSGVVQCDDPLFYEGRSRLPWLHHSLHTPTPFPPAHTLT